MPAWCLGALTCVAILAGLLFAPAASAGWRQVGDDPGAHNFLTAAGVGGVPHVAVFDKDGALWVKRLSDDGSHWVALGGGPVSGPGWVPGQPSLVDAGGVPYVAWVRSAPNAPAQLHVARFDSATGTWSEPDAGNLQVDAAADADAPALAFFGGKVYVAWTEVRMSGALPAQLYVKRLTAGGWEQPVNGSLNGDPQHRAGGPHLATSGGKLWVAWSELTDPTGPDPTSEVVVKRLNDDGTAWEEPAARPAPGPPNSVVDGFADGGGVPYLLYRTYSDTSGALFVKRLTGSPPAWQQVGGALRVQPDSGVYAGSIASVGGVPYVAWADRVGDAPIQVRVARLDAAGDGWEEPEARSLNANAARFGFSVTVASDLPDAYVAWTEAGEGPPPREPEATLVVRLEPELAPGALEFSPQPLDTTSAPRTVTFSNLTSRAVHFGAGAVTVGGPDASAFAIGSDSCSSATVGRGGSCAVDVTFTPAAVRAFAATLSFAADSPGSPYQASLAGSSPGPAPPAGLPGISINGGAQFTNDPDVTVDVVWALGQNSLRLSNDGGFAGSESVPVAAAVPWRLDPSGPERLPKTVYARFDDDTQTFTDDIILDQTAPTLSSARFAPKRKVKIAASDGISGLRSYQLTRHRSHPGKRHLFHKVVRYSGKPKTLYVRVFDRAGNRSRWARVKHPRRARHRRHGG